MANPSHRELFTVAQQAHYWNALYAQPASLFEHHMRLRRDYAETYIAAHFASDSRLLDLGCGAGVLTEKLLERGFKVTAADASQDMLDLSAQRLRHFPEASYTLRHANCLDLPFADGEFDVIVCLGMFGYFDEVSQALREIHRVLRPGGTLIISVRNANTQHLFDLFQLLKEPFRQLRQLYRRLARPVLDLPDRAAADDGFRIQIYQVPADLIAGVTQRGYALRKFDGLGYGPLSFAHKKLLSEPVSIRISDGLNRIFGRGPLNKVGRWFADVSFYVFQRTP
jgi:ubiquinone/menaquinone biosynthesis C-methylase UbiE